MTVSVSWYNDDRTIIRFEQESVWTWPEFDAAVDQAVALMKSVDHPVHVLVDIHAHGSAPDLQAFGHFQRAQHLQPSNFGQIVVIGTDPFMARIGGVFIRVFGWLGSAPRFARSYREAEAILGVHRPASLPAASLPQL